jgi:CheY-like chemotaxis protein
LEKQAAIFAPWTQLRREDERLRGGSGLGLALVHSLTELLGGRVTLESEPGRGSVFTVFVPLKSGVSKGAPGRRAGEAATPFRVLVVDDIAINRRFLRKVLETDGHRVDEAGDGTTALRMAQETRYDLLLLDCFLDDDIDGFEVARRIRLAERARGQRLPIIAVTGLAQDDERRSILEAGMDDFLEKPVHPNTLRAALSHVLAERERATAGGAL